MPTDQQYPQKIDFRIYVGILFFRWQLIVVCFLYSLLGGLLYIQFAKPMYLTKCSMMIHRESNMDFQGDGSPWRQFSVHYYLLQGNRLRERVARRLSEKWGEAMGRHEDMVLPVDVRHDRQIGSTINISVKSGNRTYARDFLSALMVEHELEWRSIQRMASDRASELLSEELARLEEQIREAEDAVIEYQRLHDIPRMSARATMESRYLTSLMARRSMLSTELMLLEAQAPGIKDASASVINDINRLTLETGAVEPEEEMEVTADGKGSGDVVGPRTGGVSGLPDRDDAVKELVDEGRGWRELRVKLIRLTQKEQELAANMKPEHPELKSVRSEIKAVQNEIDVSAQIALGRLSDRHRALTTHLKALEAAEYKWQAKNLLAVQRQGELKRLSSIVERFESNYSSIYSRLHEMRVAEELKAAHFRMIEPVASDPAPVWPDATKILLMSLALGLGSGFGLALLAQVLDNKVQSIDDVEKDLKIPFLGGIPYWAHSGLEKTIRPIVTEEHSTGAVEAYRSLRTTVISALEKINEKIIFVTSADSKEGKTLTTLNLAIMLAQMEKRVLLIDMDLRRGRLHRSLGVEKEPGVNDALRDGLGFDEVTRDSRLANLRVIASGSSADNCAEMLQEADLRAMFTEIEDDYDYILVDTAPVLRVTDTVIVATQGFGVVLYVARVGKTPLPLIRYSLDMLSDAKILGMIMNSIEMHKISSLYYSYQYPNYAYYSSAYSYGYDYYYGGDGGTGRRARGRRRRGGVGRAVGKLDTWLRRTFLPMD